MKRKEERFDIEEADTISKKNIKEEFICKLIETKQRVKIITKKGGIYTGFVVALGNNSFMFKDKFEKEMMFALDFIQVIEAVEEK